MSSNFIRGLAAAVAVVATAGSAWGQTSRIGGVVRDETGATIRGAIVKAEAGGGRSFGAPLTLTTATDDRGRFVFVVTRSGEWRLSFDAPGFAPMNIELAVRLAGPAPNLDIKLDRREAPEAFGALAGVDAKALSTQLAAAAALYDEGKLDEAIAAYRAIRAKAPALTYATLQVGNAFLAKKSYADAEAAFMEVVKADEMDASAMFAMGALREAQGNQAEARTWYEKAAAADTLWTRPLMKLADLTGDRAAASRLLTRVVEMDPASPDGQRAAELLRAAR